MEELLNQIGVMSVAIAILLGIIILLVAITLCLCQWYRLKCVELEKVRENHAF